MTDRKRACLAYLRVLAFADEEGYMTDREARAYALAEMRREYPREQKP